MFTSVNRVMIYGVFFGSVRMIIGSVSVLYLMSRGLSISEVGVLKGMQAFVMLAVDIPLGYFADRYSRHLSISLSILFGSLWLGATAYAPGREWLYLGEVFNGISLALFNGAFEAMLFDANQECPDRKMSTKAVMARYVKYNYFFMTLSIAIGGLAPSVSSPLFWWIASFVLMAQFFLGFFFLPRLHTHIQKTDSQSTYQLLHDLKHIVKTLASTNAMLPVFTISVILGIYFQMVIRYWQPMIYSGDPLSGKPIYYTGIFLMITLVQSLAGKFFERSDHLDKITILNVGLIICMGLLYVSLQYLPHLIVPSLILFFFLIRGGILHIMASFHDQIESRLRATFASFSSTMIRLSLIIGMPVIGVLIQWKGLSVLPIIGGMMFFLTGGLHFILRYQKN